jgi:hypothetical protein
MANLGLEGLKAYDPIMKVGAHISLKKKVLTSSSNGDNHTPE